MRHLAQSSLVLCLAVLLAACGRGNDPDADVLGEPDAAASQTEAPPTAHAVTERPIAAAAKPVMPVEVSNEAITLGTSLQSGRVAKAPRASFRIGDTVYASVGGGSPGKEAKIYWTYQNGLSDKEETKPLTSDGAVFSFSRADGMKPGRYSVQVDIGETPAGIVDFEVR